MRRSKPNTLIDRTPEHGARLRAPQPIMRIRELLNILVSPTALGIRPDANAGVPASGGETITDILARALRGAKDALDEALVETFPASDPIAVDPGPDRE
jgi:hypothetical protein